MKRELDTTKFHRQLGLVDPQKLYDMRVRIVGVGAVGSAVALILAKMGVGTLEIWDPDKVETHNLPNQFYKQGDVGKFKTEALKSTLEEYGAFEVEDHPEAYDISKSSNLPPADIVMCGVDDMAFRKEFWDKAIKYKYKVKLYIETRMGGEEFRIYTLDPMRSDAHAEYEKTLYGNDQADPTPCTERSILFNVMGMASIVASFVKKYAIGEASEIPYEVLGNYINTMFFTNRACQVGVADVENAHKLAQQDA